MFRGFVRIVLYLLALVVISSLVILLGKEVVGYKKTVEVPLLVGKDISEVKRILMRKGLELEIEDEVYNAEFPKGSIVRQDIGPGKRVEKGSEIRVVVSKGVEVFSMPSFEGQILEEAKLTMLNLGLKIGKITWVHSDTVEKGRIIAQRPLPGNVRENEVNLLVSLGGYDVSYKCPSFVNMTIDDARMLADALGIKLSEQGEGTRIIFQKPEAGTIIKRGDRVEVTLGRGWGFWF
jgi:serine/threonine-protein kinase